MGRRVAPSGRIAVLALSVVLVSAVAACTPEAGPTPTPTPTFSCTASAGACTPQQAEKEAQAEKDHAAAKAALQGGLAEFYSMVGERDSKPSDAALNEYFAEDELKSAEAALQKLKARERLGHGSVVIATTEFKTKYPKGSQEVLVCEDGTKFYTTDLSGKDRTPPGVRLQYTATMKLIDAKWKLTQSTESVEVSTCGA